MARAYPVWTAFWVDLIFRISSASGHNHLRFIKMKFFY